MGNRVREIHKTSKAHEWAYIRSEQNPADILSRGGTFIDREDIRQHWFNGPSWLKDTGRPPDTHTARRKPKEMPLAVPKRRELITYSLLRSRHLQRKKKLSMQTCSQVGLELEKTMAWVMRFATTCKKKHKLDEEGQIVESERDLSPQVSADECRAAEMILIRQI